MPTITSILSKAKKEDIRVSPFPHLVLNDALPEGLFLALRECYPATETIAGPGPLDNNTLYLLSACDLAENPAIPEIWRAFFDYHTARPFLCEAIDLWEDFFAEAYPDIEANFGKPLRDFTVGIRQTGSESNPVNLKEDIQLDCQFGVNSPVDKLSSVRGPHIDTPFKLFAALLYFRAPEDDSTGGELEFYRYREPKDRYRPGSMVDYRFIQSATTQKLKRIPDHHVEGVYTVPYQPNTLVMWLNTPYALHGVRPRNPTTWTRRYVNFLGESYGGRRPGFFERKRPKQNWRQMLGGTSIAQS